MTANLSSTVRAYLTSLDIADPDADEETAALIWMQPLAIGYSPAYLNENADGIRSYWPRIPLPSSKDALVHSASLGRKVAALLDTERGVAGVTEVKIQTPLDTSASSRASVVANFRLKKMKRRARSVS